MNKLQTKSFLQLKTDDIDVTVAEIIAELNNNTSYEVDGWHRLTTGQGLNFKLTSNSDQASLLLKIIAIPGYPSIPMLQNIMTLVNSSTINYPDIIYTNKTATAKYGYIVKQWIEGYAINSEQLESYLPDIVNELKLMHAITAPFFGSIVSAECQYKSLAERFCSIETDIANSFGDVMAVNYTLSNLAEMGWINPSFINNCLQQITHNANYFSAINTAGIVHGDPLPTNFIKQQKGFAFIDWDEAHFNWFGYDIARLSYYEGDAIIQPWLEAYNADLG